MDTDLNPDIQKQIAEANAIFDEGKHFDAQSRKARHPIEFVLHTTTCTICFRVMMRNNEIQTLKEFQEWSHKSREVQCEKVGHTKWLVQNMFSQN